MVMETCFHCVHIGEVVFGLVRVDESVIVVMEDLLGCPGWYVGL